MKLLLCIIFLTTSFVTHAKMVLPKEIKKGPITKDACGNFEDGIKALERLQDTTNFSSDGQIALYTFSARAQAALYKQKMIHEKDKKKKAYYRNQYQMACQNAG